MSLTTDTHHFFWRGPFSNWHPAPIKGPAYVITFANSEQAFMHAKAVFFGDFETAGYIAQNGADPQVAKRAGRLIKGYDDKAWSCVRVGFMTYVNYLKFSQNAELRIELLNTGSRVLVEASPLDTVWGIGLAEEDPLALDPANWKGQNLLGQALMTVREMVR